MPASSADLGGLLDEAYPLAVEPAEAIVATAANEPADPRYAAMERLSQRKPLKESKPAGGLGTAIGGLATMALAVIWFVASLFVGFIFFYPSIMFLIGLGVFLKGIFQHVTASRGVG